MKIQIPLSVNNRLPVWMLLMATILLTVAQQVNADTKPVDNTTAMESVVAIQKSLADDSLDKVKFHSEVISTWVHEVASVEMDQKIVCKALQKMGSEELNVVRKAYKEFNTHLIKYLKAHPLDTQEYREAYCPMAKAGWVQKGNEIANPYYGKSMLKCGTFKKTGGQITPQ